MIYRFESCDLDTKTLELRHESKPVAVEPQVFSLLLFLIENRDRVVSKDELIDAVWEGRIVSDATLNSRINAARRAVGDTGREQHIIRTAARRGFQFVADVSEDGEAAAAQPAAAAEDRGPDVSLNLPDNPSIVVLPFDNLSDDPGQEYFSDGVTEDITMALSHIRWLFVIARNTAFTYKGAAHDVRRVASELGVRYVLQGSVRKVQDRVRVSAQLVDGITGRQVWGERFDNVLSDIFALQDSLTESIIAQIEPELHKAEQRRARLTRRENLHAWDFYQRGMWHLYKWTGEDLAEAHQLFDRALALDPGLVPALTGAVEAYYYQAVLGLTDKPQECRDRALDFARRAVDLDGEDAFAHNAVGRARIIRREHDAAMSELQFALELNPSLAWAHYGLGAATVFSGGDGRQAIGHIERAIRLSPRDAHMGSFLVRMADAHLAIRDYDGAVAWARKSLQQPGFQWSRYAVLIAALGHLGRKDEAAVALEELHSRRPDFSLSFLPDNHLYTPTETFDHFLDGLGKAGVKP